MLGRRMKLAAGVVAALAVIVPMSTANAATQDLEFTNTAGTVMVGSLPTITIPAGDAGLTGTWDDATGEFTGTTQFNPITVPASPPTVPISVVVQLRNNGTNNVTGTIDPATGEADLTASMVFRLTVPGTPPAPDTVCDSPAFDVEFFDETALDPIPFDPQADYSISLDGPFTLPAFGQDCPLGAVINSILGLPTGGDVALDLVRGTPAPPTTPPPTSPTTATTAAVAAATQPKFTG
jgi:hypothetical protein